jgi:hypothetical protein
VSLFRVTNKAHSVFLTDMFGKTFVLIINSPILAQVRIYFGLKGCPKNCQKKLSFWPNIKFYIFWCHFSGSLIRLTVDFCVICLKKSLFLSSIHLYWPTLEYLSDIQGVPKIAQNMCHLRLKNQYFT